MMGATKLTAEQMDHIVTLAESGIQQTKIAVILGVSEYTVSSTYGIYQKIKNGEPLPKHLERTPGTIKWACEKLGKTVAVPTKETKEDNTALAFSSLLEAIKSPTSAVDAIDQRLSAMQMTIAGARDEARQDAKKIVEAININGDIQTKEWQSIKEKLDAIKTNTKIMTRKGYES